MKFQPGALAAHELVEIDMLNPSAAPTARELWPPLLVPRHQDRVPVDQNILCVCVSGELAGNDRRVANRRGAFNSAMR